MSELTGKRILITGGAGYLATAVASSLKSADCHVVRLARPGKEFPQLEGIRTADITGDLNRSSTWDKALAGVDVVFHFAAQTSVYAANDNPCLDLETNMVPMVQLLESCRRMKRSVILLFSGTVTEAGIPAAIPVNEDHPDLPVTIYDLHKLMAENYLKYYARQGLVQGAVLRLANVYGPGPRSSNPDRGVLNRWIRRALEGHDIEYYGTGNYVRDYVYVEDVADAFLKAAAHAGKLGGNHFVIGTGLGHTIAETVRMVADAVRLKTGKKVTVRSIPPPSGLSAIEFRNFVGDSTRFTRATGWKAATTLAKGIDRTIEAFLQHTFNN